MILSEGRIIRLHLSATEKRLSSVRTNGNKEGNLYRDRERLVRTNFGSSSYPSGWVITKSTSASFIKSANELGTA